MDVRLINDLAVTLMRLGRFDESKKELERAQKLDPNHVDVKNNLKAVIEHLNYRDLGITPDRGEKQVDPDDDGSYRPGLFRNPNAKPKPKSKPKPKQQIDDSHLEGSAVPSSCPGIVEWRYSAKFLAKVKII